MTKESLLAILDAAGGDDHLLGLQFDNGMIFRMNHGINDFQRDRDLLELGGEEFYVNIDFAPNRITGKYDIVSKSYHPLDCLQAVLMIPEDDIEMVDVEMTLDIHN